jgi:hypothetical protein
MNHSHENRTDVSARRPWPFGPPLRGRAPRRDVGPQAAHTSLQALAPVGGLAYPHPIYGE